MKARKITLAIAAVALAAPAVLATTSSAAQGCQVVPCFTLNSAHTASFDGTYQPTTGATNTTADGNAGSDCEDGNSNALSECEFRFESGNPATLCDRNTSTPWSTNWVYRPAASQANDYGGDALYAEGGGLIDFTGTNFGTDGVAVTTHVQINIVGVCGNEDTVQRLADDVSATSGLGTLDTEKSYKFSGSIDITTG